MSSIDKTKLDGVTANASKVVNSSTNGNIVINGTESVVYTHPSGTNPHGTTKLDVGLGNLDNIQQASKTEFNTHNGDNTRHITSGERTSWGSKTDKYTINIGNGIATEFTLAHNLATTDITTSIKEIATNEFVWTDIFAIDNNTAKVIFANPPTTSQYRVVVIG